MARSDVQKRMRVFFTCLFLATLLLVYAGYSLNRSSEEPVVEVEENILDLEEEDVREFVPLEFIKHENEKALLRLGRKFGTDKVSYHAYHRSYNQFFDRDRTKKILEVGISQGHSIKMWLDYFPNAQVHGMELKQSSTNWGITSERFTPWIGSMTDRKYLAWFIKQHANDPFDIIVDDGAHSRESNQVCWEVLFPSKALKDGGYYSIEDVGVGFESRSTKDFATTDIAKQWIDVIHRFYFSNEAFADSLTAKAPHLLTGKADHQIESMFVGDQIIILRKRTAGPLRAGAGFNPPPLTSL